MLSRFVKNQKGMTLVEVLIAAVLLAGVSAIGFQVILSAQQTQATVAQRVGEEIDLSQGLLELRAELSSAYVMRSGQLNCGEIGKLVRTNRSVQNFELMDQGKANFSFYYSTFSAVASRDLRHSNNVFVTDAARFNPGQVVLMMGAQNADVAGFYKIQSKEVINGKVTGRLALEPVDLSANPTECKPSGPAMPLDLLFQKASVFLIHEVSFVTYRFRPARDQVAGDNGQPIQTFDLFKSYWPAAGAAAAVPARLSIPRVTSLKINPSWVEYGQLAQEYNSRSGRWMAAVGLRSYRKTLYGNNNRQIRFSPYQAGIRALYELPSSRPLNPVAQVGAATVQVQFPTCATFLQRTDNFRPLMSESSAVFLVETVVSENVLGALQVSVESSGGNVNCYQDPGTGATNLVSYGKHFPVYSVSGETNSYQRYFCEATGDLQIQKSDLTYIDRRTGRTYRQACSLDKVQIPDRFQHKNSSHLASCSSNGSIDFGSPLIATGKTPEVAGPLLYVGPQSCRWQTNGQILQTTCHEKPDDPAAKLLAVELLPRNLNLVAGGGLNVTCTQ